MIDRSEKRSADDITFTRELIKTLNDGDSQNAALILNELPKVEAVDKILAYAGVPSKIAGVIELEDGRRRQSIQPMNQVWDGKAWQLFNPESGAQGVGPNILIWDESNVSLLDLIGGSNSQVLFSMIAQEVSAKQQPTTKWMLTAYSTCQFTVCLLRNKRCLKPSC
ncbi:hypothetical protein JCM19233_2497 [Vibrio astriarenae]|nr:hypothetical protein JCM19233_2497 [Vibrio sp. C7]